MKRVRQFRFEQSLLDRFDRINEFLATNGSEVIRRLMEQYVAEKEEELKVKVEEVIEMKEDFPTDGEAYAVGKANNLYFFAWGSEIPFADEIPYYEIPDGASGISWYNSKNEALAAMKQAIEAREDEKQ